jgi:hypothetical protein
VFIATYDKYEVLLRQPYAVRERNIGASVHRLSTSRLSPVCFIGHLHTLCGDLNPYGQTASGTCASAQIGTSGSMANVVVVVATCNRPHLLDSVCLPSILQQTAVPSSVVVVNDSQVSDSCMACMCRIWLCQANYVGSTGTWFVHCMRSGRQQ